MARRSNPVVILVSLAITVTMALLVLWQWAAVNTTVDAEPVVQAPADPTIIVSTPVLSARRTPGVLSRAVNAIALRNQLVPLASRVGESSCAAVSVDGLTVSSVNAQLTVLPASTLKVVVAAVALDVLGEGHRFRTSVHADVEANGVVPGDLVLVGGGDPVLVTAPWLAESGQTYPPINVTSFEALADAVVAAGVTRVDGRVVGSGGRYDDERFIPSWSEAIRVTEAGPYDALMVDDGRLPGGGVASDPALGAAQILTELLLDRGIEIAEEPAADSAVAVPVEVASVESVDLAGIIAEMLVTSDDNTAELLVKEIGFVTTGEGTTAAGLTEIEDRLRTWGVPLDGVALSDGSGLSRDNRLTCAALMAVLQFGDIDDPVGRGMPVAAQSGTLIAEFENTPMSGILRGKTGSLTDVKALVGYVPAPDGAVIEYTLILNEPAVQQSAFRDVWERLLASALGSYPSGPGADDLAPR